MLIKMGEKTRPKIEKRKMEFARRVDSIHRLKNNWQLVEINSRISER